MGTVGGDESVDVGVGGERDMERIAGDGAAEAGVKKGKHSGQKHRADGDEGKLLVVQHKELLAVSERGTDRGMNKARQARTVAAEAATPVKLSRFHCPVLGRWERWE